MAKWYAKRYRLISRITFFFISFMAFAIGADYMRQAQERGDQALAQERAAIPVIVVIVMMPQWLMLEGLLALQRAHDEHHQTAPDKGNQQESIGVIPLRQESRPEPHYEDDKSHAAPYNLIE